MDKAVEREIIAILKEELIPAMGCTEPIAIAYASALAFDLLGEEVEKVRVFLSPNIIKNVKSVVVPHTGGERGIVAASAIGICGGEAEKKLNVLSSVTQEDIERSRELRRRVDFQVERSVRDYIFSIIIEMEGRNNSSRVELAGNHTNVIEKRRNGEVVFSKPYE